MEEDDITPTGSANPTNPFWSNPQRDQALKRQRALGRIPGITDQEPEPESETTTTPTPAPIRFNNSKGTANASNPYWSGAERQYALQRQKTLSQARAQEEPAEDITEDDIDDIIQEVEDNPEEAVKNTEKQKGKKKSKFAEMAKRMFESFSERARAYGEERSEKSKKEKQDRKNRPMPSSSVSGTAEAVNKKLSEIVSVLKAIDSTLKDQLKFDQDTFINSRIAERESDIEGGDGAKKDKKFFWSKLGNKLKSGLINLVSPLGGLAIATFTSLMANLRGVIDRIVGKIESFINFFKGKDKKSPSGSPSSSTPPAPDESFNVAFGYSKTPKPLTEMTIREVLDYQRSTLLPSKGSSAVGAYQINIATIEDFGPKVLGPGWLDKKFDATTQYKLAEAIFESSKGNDITNRWASLKGKVAPTGYKDKNFADVERDIRLAEGTLRSGVTPMDAPVQTAGLTPQPETGMQGGPPGDIISTVMGILRNFKDDQMYYVELNELGKKVEAINSTTNEIDNAVNLGEKTREAVNQGIEAMAAGQPRQKPNMFMEAIDPNYRLSEANIITNYLMTFGVRSA